ncbi:MAG: hypothetical protein WA755_00225 [Candidatus Acidiferrales bacterium]
MNKSGESDEGGKKAVAAKLSSCIRLFLRNDAKLLALNVSERAITHKFAEYLANRFPSWDVDCEYDRILEQAKRLRIRARLARVIPDIIIHHRNTGRNLLVIEAKKDNDRRGEATDLEKLREFRSQLCYRYAVFLRFRTGKNPGIENPLWI